MTKEKIQKDMDKTLRELNSAQTYDVRQVKKLIIITERIKRFVIDSTKIDGQIKKIYRKFAPGIYFITAYSQTHDFSKALKAYKLIELWGGYIQYEDLYYERVKKSDKTRLRNIALKFKKRAMQTINPAVKHDIVKADATLQRYWQTEIACKKTLRSNNQMSDQKIKDFVFLKAKSITCYPYLMKQYADIPENLVRLITLNQAIFDFYDDYWDLKEDLKDKAPNTFIFALRGIDTNKLRQATREQIISMIKERKVWVRLRTIAYDFLVQAEKIKLPQHYQFWHHLPRYNYEFFDEYFS